MIKRAVNASSLFQLPAFLADIYAVESTGLRLVRDMPVEHALAMPGWREGTLAVMTVEYGHLPPGADPSGDGRRAPGLRRS
jgi:hypothetical protein